MKKLLILLSVLTISGTATPTVIAASSYQKQKSIKNSKINYQQTNNLKNLKRNKREIISANKKIWFGGFDGDSYKGEMKINSDEKKIRFFGNNDKFHKWFSSDIGGVIYYKISIKDHLGNIIKYIEMHSQNSMQDVIRNNNLENGIDYQDEYIVEIYAKEAWRIWFNIGNENYWKRFTFPDSHDHWDWNWKFRIKNNQIVTYYDKCQINSIIKNTNLKTINKNIDSIILNELNYLNHNLDISQLEVINKINTSATIKAKSNSTKYLGEKKIYYTLNNQQNKIINLDELIKKGIFLNFRDKNQGIIIKEIININKNNLIYSNVTATKSIEPTYTKNSKSICFGTTTLFHNLSEKQNMKTPSCNYTKETTINTQITTGLSKTDSEETRTEQSYSSSVEHNWSFELGVNVHGEAGVWPFTKVSTDINTKVGVGGNYGSSTTNTSSETKTLSNTFDFSNSKTNEYKEISEVELPSQEISVNPNQKIKVTASLDGVLAQVTLNLKQDIYGAINAKIITLNNEEKNIRLSIKEIMQKLKQYDLLPQEIIINNNDTITFNGKASRSLKQGFDGNIEFHEVN